MKVFKLGSDEFLTQFTQFVNLMTDDESIVIPGGVSVKTDVQTFLTSLP